MTSRSSRKLLVLFVLCWGARFRAKIFASNVRLHVRDAACVLSHNLLTTWVATLANTGFPARSTAQNRTRPDYLGNQAARSCVNMTP